MSKIMKQPLANVAYVGNSFISLSVKSKNPKNKNKNVKHSYWLLSCKKRESISFTRSGVTVTARV